MSSNLSHWEKNEGFAASYPIVTSILLKFLLRVEVNDICVDDEACLHKHSRHAPDLMGTLDAMEEVGPSSLSKKFSNGTSTVDIYVDDMYISMILIQMTRLKVVHKMRRRHFVSNMA
ncbi:hypothetical protein Fot_56566 [Forsythia ovata]|uniref:Uncharacterized protein n=1 Tax=Forsythia ovata TaxID=205694 RepID=A0ABD1NZF2_9LAMI